MSEYKLNNIGIWNEIAPRYHSRWIRNSTGPFKSSDLLLKMSGIKRDSSVLDVACGTGIISKKISQLLSQKGKLIGIDTSIEAIRIAKRNIKRKNANFVIADAESLFFSEKFDVITCQFGLFFFPNSKKALMGFKNLLKSGGIIAISVHGKGKKVPFFHCILEAVTKYVPDYMPKDGPDLDRFGIKKNLIKEVKDSGFKRVLLNEFMANYSPGTFADYWSDYLTYIAKPLKDKIENLSPNEFIKLKERIKKNTLPYTKSDGKILFPWQVNILTAKNV